MSNQPVAFNVALGGVVSTGVTLAALLWPSITVELQIAIVAFANSLIVVIVWYLTQRQVTPINNAQLVSGTPVGIIDEAGKPTGDSVIVQTSPPGSTDIAAQPATPGGGAP